MKQWAVDLQKFFTSWARDTPSLHRAEKECDDSTVQAYLRKLPVDSEETILQGQQIAAMLAQQNLKAEAALLRILALMPFLANAENPRAIHPEKRAGSAKFLTSITESCRVDAALSPSLAFMSNLCGLFYLGLHDFAVARDAFEEASDIYGRLAEADPQTYEPDLAMTLNNLGALCSDTRDFAAALGAFERARHIYAKLAAADPQTCKQYLATTLNNLGVVYSNTRDFAAARGACEEARDIYAKLAEADPQACQPDLAMTLNNIGNLYSDTRDFSAAREAYGEARDIQRKLAEADPQTYQPNLAGALNNLGAFYRNTGNFAAARGVYEEARNIYAKLAEADPQTYQPDLAMTLSNLGTLYRNTGDFTAALGACEEACDIRRKLAEADPQTYQPDLAGTLNNLGTLHRHTRDFVAARAAFEEAVALAERAQSASDVHLAKGTASAAYRGLISDAVTNNPERVFAFAGALRDGRALSRDIDQSDLEHSQAVLRGLEEDTEKEQYVLFANAGAADDENVVLGLIGASGASWFNVKAEGWNALFPNGDLKQDDAARRDLARSIWLSLPEAVRDALDPQRPGDTHIWISGDGFYTAFPWELLRFGDGGNDYLGLHHALPRIGSILAPALKVVTRADGKLGHGARSAAIVAPHTTWQPILNGVLREAQALEKRIPEMNCALPVFDTGEGAHDGLMCEAIEARPDVLYYTGHGAIVANEEVLVLHAEKPRGPKPKDRISYFGRYQIDQIAAGFGVKRALDHSPLVVLNSCSTGRTKDHGGQREDFVDALLAHGAGAVIATALPIYAAVGEVLGSALFSDDVVGQNTIGEGVIEARRKLAQGLSSDVKSPFWGAWAMVHVHGRALAAHPFQYRKEIFHG